MRKRLALDTTFTHDASGQYQWCVRNTMIESSTDKSLTTVSKRLSAFDRGVKSVMGGVVCDGDTTEWKNGKCRTTVKLNTACDGDLAYDADAKVCVPKPEICGDLTLDPTTGRCVANESVCDSASTSLQNGVCVSTVDVTTDNAAVCSGPNLRFDSSSGACTVDSTTMCGAKAKYNAETDQCERDGGGGCAIM